MYQEAIRIGTIIGAGACTGAHIRRCLALGFESFEISFPHNTDGMDLAALAEETRRALDGSGAVISCLGLYANPLGYEEDHEAARRTWSRMIDAASLFGCDLVTGFAGRVPYASIPDSMARFKEIFEPIALRAGERGLRIGFENCEMGGDWHKGDWNIALGPTAWEMMFEALPLTNLGLEWEPCHQLVKLIDPMPQLRKWVHRIFHVHGKDATVMWDVIREYGIVGPRQFAFHRTPGFGDSNWSDIITELRMAGFTGSIDIEGYHDPVYRGELEMMGQVRGLNYLKDCRGGAYIPPLEQEDAASAAPEEMTAV